MTIPKWQDGVQSAATAILGASLLPSIFTASKPAVATSLMSAAALVGIIAVVASYRLKLAVVVTAVEVAAWLLLAAQGAHYVR